MYLTEKNKFQAQMEFLKKANFQEYLKQHQWTLLLLLLVPFLFDFLEGISWLTVIKGIVLLLIELCFSYWIYRFFRKIAISQKKNFSRTQLFWAYFINFSLFQFVLQLNFNKVNTKNFFICLVTSLIFGFMLGGTFYSCMNENIKDYLKSIL